MPSKDESDFVPPEAQLQRHVHKLVTCLNTVLALRALLAALPEGPGSCLTLQVGTFGPRLGDLYYEKDVERLSDDVQHAEA